MGGEYSMNGGEEECVIDRKAREKETARKRET
jgi:hypothetical protein